MVGRVEAVGPVPVVIDVVRAGYNDARFALTRASPTFSAERICNADRQEELPLSHGRQARYAGEADSSRVTGIRR